MKYSFLLSLFFLASCGKNLEDVILKDGKVNKKHTHEDFYPYLEEISPYFNSVKSSIIYETPDKSQTWVGICRKWNNSDYTEIAIDKNYWNLISHGAKLQLLLHELGHCELNKGHNDVVENNCPNSVMRSYAFNQYEIDNCFLDNFENYIENLFNLE